MDFHVFLDSVIATIYERDDTDKVERVYIHADGVSGIKTFETLMLDAIFVMDGFHIEKYFKKPLLRQDRHLIFSYGTTPIEKARYEDISNRRHKIFWNTYGKLPRILLHS